MKQLSFKLQEPSRIKNGTVIMTNAEFKHINFKAIGCEIKNGKETDVRRASNTEPVVYELTDVEIRNCVEITYKITYRIGEHGRRINKEQLMKRDIIVY